MAIYWPTPGFKGRMFKLCVLTRWDFNFCIRSSPLRETNKAEIRPEEQSERAGSWWENLWNEIQLKVPQKQKHTQGQSKKEWASSVGLRQKHKLQHPHHVKGSPRETSHPWRSHQDRSSNYKQKLESLLCHTSICYWRGMEKISWKNRKGRN